LIPLSKQEAGPGLAELFIMRPVGYKPQQLLQYIASISQHPIAKNGGSSEHVDGQESQDGAATQLRRDFSF
jgi:hypothetical protein